MKNIGKLFMAIAITMFFAVQANAQNTAGTNQSTKKQTAGNSTYGNFVDKDNNGVCDNFGTRAGKGRSANFIDKNNDGICDNRANVGNKSGKPCKNGKGNQYRNGQGKGQGKCQRQGQGQGQGQSQGQGQGQGQGQNLKSVTE
jgi:hypothetical protein